MEIRHVKSTDDRADLSRIYEESWKYAYKNIIPDSYLQSIPEGKWVKSIDKPDISHIVIIENDKFIGTSSYCGSRFPQFEGFGEIISIYFLPEYIGRGYGKELLNFAIDQLYRSGYKDIFLWVLEDNMRARMFYEKEGFVKTDKYIDDNIGDKPLREIAYTLHINRSDMKE